MRPIATGRSSPGRAFRPALAAVAAAGALVLAGCGGTSSGSGAAIVTIPSTAAPSGSGSSSQPVPSSGTLLDETLPASVRSLGLRDQDGKVVTLASLQGKTVVVSPNLTLCQEICPLISTNLGVVDRAVNASGLQDDVVILEVTVDPGRDDQKHLKAYQGLFGAEPNWEFLRGTPAQIAAFWKGFHLSYDKTANDPGGPTPHDWLTGTPLTYDVQHQNVVYVLGPDGHTKWLVDASPNINGAAIPGTLEKYLSDEGTSNATAPPDPTWTAQDVEQAVAYVSGKPVQGS